MQNYVDQQISHLHAFNAIQLERARSAMYSQAVNIFNILPILLHFNHPSLPGYLDADVAHGIAAFSPNALQLDFIQDCALAQGVEAAVCNDSKLLPIKGLFSMGSTASMGQSFNSDLDIWVCVQPWVGTQARALLEDKCLAITDWALSEGVEVNFFVICEQRFRHQFSQEMTSDNCGSSQHYLLLDEFYRSAMHLAGQQLLWCIIPPEKEACYEEYVQQLLKETNLKREDWVDFGGLPSIPAEEYFGSSLWQLYKSIDSPYKSALKAILLEAYSWEYPNTQLLSLDGKRHFFSGKFDTCHSDAYYLMLEKVTQYLESIGDPRRLDLVRRCFYLKTNEKLSYPPGVGSVPWRRECLIELTQKWGWEESELRQLDNRSHWKVGEVKEAHNELLDALMLSYRNLIRFARRNNITSAISPEDISILARKLYAAFEVLPGKVTLLNPQLSPDLHEENLSFVQVLDGHVNPLGWYLYKQSLKPLDILGRAPLEHNRYLSKLIAWAYFNGLLTESTKLHSVIRDSHVDADILTQFVCDMRNTFHTDRPQPSLEALSNPCEIRKLALFVNLEEDPTSDLQNPVTRFDFKNTDILSYGKEQMCLIGSVDLIYRNSWNEVRTLNFKGKTAMLDVLKTLLGKMHQEAISPESVDVFCYAGKMRGLIRNWVYQLVAECIDMRLQPAEKEKSRRFKAIRIEDKTFGLFFERRGVSVQKLENRVDFYRSISVNKLNCSPEKLAGKEESSLPAVVDAHASEGLIQFFFEDGEKGFNIYVLDEHNRLEVYQHCDGDKDELVQGLNRFYTSSQAQEPLNYAGSGVNFNLPQFYEIVYLEKGRKQVVPYKSERSSQRPSSSVQQFVMP